MKSTAAEREEAMNKRLVLGAVAVMLAVAGGFSWFSSLQSQAVPMTREEMWAQREEEDRRRHITPPEVLAKCLGRAKYLREKWRPWAEKNQAMLKRMLAAKPEDQAAMLAVWEATPFAGLQKEGITYKDLYPGANLDESIKTGLTFTWAASGKMPYNQAWLNADPKRQAHLTFTQGLVQKTLQSDFAALRDIAIAQSVNQGRQRIRLWASGRITQGGTIDNPNPGPGKPNTVAAPDSELVPPYDFL